MQTSDQYYESGRLKTRTISNLDNLGRKFDAEIQEFNEDGTYKNTKFQKSVGGVGVTYQEKVYISGILDCVKFYNVDSGKSILERVDVFNGKVKVQSIEIYKNIDSVPVLSAVEEFTYYVGQVGIMFYDVDLDGRKTKKQRSFKNPETNEVLRIEFYTDDECTCEYIYKDGKRVELKEYGISDGGEKYMKKDTFLDANGNPERIEAYKSAGEGKLIHEETVEFEMSPDGTQKTMLIYHPFIGGRELTYKQIIKLPDNKPVFTEWYKDGVLCQDAEMADDNDTKTVTIYKNESGKPVAVRKRVYRSGQLVEDQPVK